MPDLFYICNALGYESCGDDTTPYAFRQIYIKAIVKVLKRNINKMFAWLKHKNFLVNSGQACFLLDPLGKIRKFGNTTFYC